MSKVIWYKAGALNGDYHRGSYLSLEVMRGFENIIMTELARTLPASWYCNEPLYRMERRAVFLKVCSPF